MYMEKHTLLSKEEYEKVANTKARGKGDPT